MSIFIKRVIVINMKSNLSENKRQANLRIAFGKKTFYAKKLDIQGYKI